MGMNDWNDEEEGVLAQKVVRRPYWWASLFLGLLGLVLLLFVPIAGLGLLVLAGLIDRPRYVCGNCGNAVEKTSLLCPTCRAELTKKARR
jgi:hypothetical protein